MYYQLLRPMLRICTNYVLFLDVIRWSKMILGNVKFLNITLRVYVDRSGGGLSLAGYEGAANRGELGAETRRRGRQR